MNAWRRQQWNVRQKAIKKPAFWGGLAWNPVVLWILPAPAVPWIGRYDSVINDVPMGAHKCAGRPTLPLAHRFGFGESQHSQLWSRRLDSNQRPRTHTEALNAWARRKNQLILLQPAGRMQLENYATRMALTTRRTDRGNRVRLSLLYRGALKITICDLQTRNSRGRSQSTLLELGGRSWVPTLASRAVLLTPR